MGKIALIALCSCFLPLGAEIERVTVRWDKGICLQTCAESLAEQFRKIPDVTEVNVNQAAAQADLKWKKDVAFSWLPVMSALSMIGLFPEDVRIRVRGIITHDEKHINLISKPDGTFFVLFSPVTPNLGGYTEMFSQYAYSVSPDARDQLLQAEQAGKLVTVEGPILQPERSPPDPLRLIMQSMTISQ